jgi:hypothetical protein
LNLSSSFYENIKIYFRNKEKLHTFVEDISLFSTKGLSSNIKIFVMKHFFLIICIFSIIFATSCSSGTHYIAQKDVPSAVIYAFKSKYPDGKVQKWELEKEGLWEVYFKDYGKNREAYFRTDGTFVKVE